MDKTQSVEHSIITKYKKTLFHRFIGAVKDYELISKGDKIAVCISGGKDSMLLAKLMQELSKHGEYPFDMEFIVMNPGYAPQNLQKIIDNSQILGIPVKIYAQSLGCNKIALGHHFDDVVETILMGMLYGAQIQTMMPRIKSTNFDGMELIRPMYYIREKDIISWRNYNKLEFLQCACRFTEQNALLDGTGTSKRQEVKNLIKEMKKVNPQVDINIFRSVERVNLSTIIGYYNEDEEHNFLEKFK